MIGKHENNIDDGCIGALAGCASLGYLWIDRSITLSYVNQSVDAANTSTRQLDTSYQFGFVNVNLDIFGSVRKVM
jgi:hypothetical protein